VIAAMFLPLIAATITNAEPAKNLQPVLRWIFNDPVSDKYELRASARRDLNDAGRHVIYVQVADNNRKVLGTFLYDVRTTDLVPTSMTFEGFASKEKFSRESGSAEQKFGIVMLIPSDRGVSIDMGRSLCFGLTGFVEWDTDGARIVRGRATVKCCF
jgi:hypothetical protein